jgi:uncharacterized protein YifN (PemK superfamily)
MPLQRGIRPAPGQVFICDFGPDPDSIVAPGVMRGPLAVKPEIWKDRHVVVLSSSFETTTVVPFSTKAPRSPTKVHHCIPAGTYAFMDQHEDSWLKGDLITTVSNSRLDRPFVGNRRTVVSLSKDDLRAVRKAVLNALRLGVLAPYLDPPPDPQGAAPQENPSGSAETGSEGA